MTPSERRDQGAGSAHSRPRHRKEGPVVEDREARISRILDRLESASLSVKERSDLEQLLEKLQDQEVKAT